ncbi:MAG TPA: PIN domain-containing protein [Anaeromyxobacteraceae bacterium]|nr:PIN domain-containing protein [Anaeromyxobacteraceae bacterium]
MNALVIDTSSWISILAGGAPEAVQRALRAGRVVLPPVVAAELLSGKMPPRRRTELRQALRGLVPFPADLAHWFRVGDLRADLAARGVTVSVPDAHVAQCALDLDAQLMTEDRIFALVARHAPLRVAG